MSELNTKQRLAIQGVASGLSYEDAAKAAGYASKQSVHRMMTNDDAQDYLKELTDKAEKKAEKVIVGHILTIEERKAMLTRISSTNEDEDPNASRQAIAELNKMDGAYSPEKVDHTHDIEVIIGGAVDA